MIKAILISCLAAIAILAVLTVHLSRDSKRSFLRLISDWMVWTGCEQTTSGAYSIYYDDICNQFGVSEKFLQKNHDKLIDYIDGDHEEILSETWDELDDNGNQIGFNMNFGTAYCPNLEE